MGPNKELKRLQEIYQEMGKLKAEAAELHHKMRQDLSLDSDGDEESSDEETSRPHAPEALANNIQTRQWHPSIGPRGETRGDLCLLYLVEKKTAAQCSDIVRAVVARSGSGKEANKSDYNNVTNSLQRLLKEMSVARDGKLWRLTPNGEKKAAEIEESLAYRSENFATAQNSSKS